MMPKTDRELFGLPDIEANTIPKIRIMHMRAAQLRGYMNSSIYMRSTMFILVLSGKATIEINFKTDTVDLGMIILLSFGHFFKVHQLSSDFTCEILYISEEYIDKMYSTDLVYKRVKYGVKMHQTPLLHLQPSEYILLLQRITFIRDLINDISHLYYQEITLSGLNFFFLDLMQIIEKGDHDKNVKISRDQYIFKQFLELLVVSYKSYHQVEFYADKLHITTHYLAMIVRRVSGQSVSNLISQLLYTEAKLMLQQPNLLIQQIAEELNFADQSSFGKFFKRFSGYSPKQFRNNRILKM